MASRRRTSKRSRRSKSPKRTRSKVSKRSSRRSKSRKSKGSKRRPLNQFFKMMLDARKRGLPSFTYKNKTYTDKSGSGFYKRGR